MGNIRVIIADDHPLMRQGLIKVLQIDKDIKVVGEAADGEEVIKMVIDTCPHVILMDLNMPKFSGAEAARIVLESNPNIKIIALTVDDCEERAVNLIKTGLAGYLLKDVNVDALISAIKAVYAGETVITPKITQMLLKEKGSLKNVDDYMNSQNQLTPRELQIIKLIAGGKNNKEIAEELFISEKTVKNHVTSIFRKTKVQDRTQAALYALKTNLVELE